MSVELSSPPRQFMPVTPGVSPAEHINVSGTDELLYPNLERAEGACKSPYMIRSFEIRQCLFKCCGTEGAGSRKSVCPWFCKAKSIKYTANCGSALATFFRGIFTCGYLCYQDCNGCLDDQKRLSARVSPS